MQQIELSAGFRIHPDHGDEFRELAGRLIDRVRETEPNALVYNWFLTADGKRCSVREVYRDSDAVLFHLENSGDLLAQITTCAELDLELFGPVSEALEEAVAALEPRLYGYHDGVVRD